MGKKVLITGATGFIGNHVTRLCLEKGDQVRVMVMPGEDRSALDGMDVEFVEANLLDASSLGKTVKGIEQVYHLAALFKVWTKDPHLHHKINVEGAQALMRAAQAEGVEKVVFTSSIAALGLPNDPNVPMNEDNVFDCWDMAGPYILSKYISHQLVQGMVSRGLDATIVMPCFPFGPGDRMPTPTGTIILGVLQGKMNNWFSGGLAAGDVRDVAAGHVLAMEKGEIGDSYILGNAQGNLTHREFAQMVGRIAGVDGVAEKQISDSMMLRVGKLMDVYSNLTGREPMTTLANSRYALSKPFVDPSKAIEKLGLPQSSLEQAVQDSIDWFRANGYVDAK